MNYADIPEAGKESDALRSQAESVLKKIEGDMATMSKVAGVRDRLIEEIAGWIAFNDVSLKAEATEDFGRDSLRESSKAFVALTERLENIFKADKFEGEGQEQLDSRDSFIDELSKDVYSEVIVAFKK